MVKIFPFFSAVLAAWLLGWQCMWIIVLLDYWIDCHESRVGSAHCSLLPQILLRKLKKSIILFLVMNSPVLLRFFFSFLCVHFFCLHEILSRYSWSPEDES